VVALATGGEALGAVEALAAVSPGVLGEPYRPHPSFTQGVDQPETLGDGDSLGQLHATSQ
jgi:hypothetical protein